MTVLSIPPIFDGHNDTLLNLYLSSRGEGRSFFEHSSVGHIDLPRAREGGLGGGFFAVFVPNEGWTRDMDGAEIVTTPEGEDVRIAPRIDLAYAQKHSMAMVASLFRIEAESAGQVKVVRTVDDLMLCLQNRAMAAILHFEGAEAIDTNLDALEVFYQAGLRSLGLVWSRPNAFACGVPFKFGHPPNIGPGLSDAGRALVRSCNELGIMIDLSHLNEQGFWDVAELSTAPLVATHSNAYAISPSTRNLTDEQLAAIRDSDGMVGVNFHVGFLSADGSHDADVPLSVVVDHVDYLVEHLGVERVGFGSDFDGATMPQELGDATGLPKLLAILRERGYDDAALRKLAYENWVRVLQQTWRSV
ncbi:MAG: dipeptidase [Chloroflexota bacterium]